MATLNERRLIPASASGTGKNVYNNTSLFFNQSPVSGKFDKKGLLVITGTNIQKLDEWIFQQSPEALEAWFKKVQTSSGINWKEFYNKLHWTDILALSLVSKTKGVNPYTQLQGYHAGENNNVYMDEQAILTWIKEIYDSNGSQDWNKIITRMYPPITDDSVQPDSPFNPESPIFNPNKPIYTYDPDNGIVIYKSGEILWQKTGGQYFDSSNGQAVSYDKTGQTVQFFSGSVLNLKTLELTKPDKQTVIIKNTLLWYQQLFINLLSDKKTQLTVLGILILILIIKKNRKDAN